MDSDDQRGIETQVAGVVAGAATDTVKSNPPLPRSTNSIDHGAHEPQSAIVDASPANPTVKSNPNMPGTHQRKRNSHKENGAPAEAAVAGRTRHELKPIGHVSGQPSSNGQGRRETPFAAAVAGDDLTDHETRIAPVVAGRTNDRLEPNSDVSGQSSSNGQTTTETLAAHAVAGDDQGRPETQTMNVVAGHDRAAPETHLATVVATIRELWRRRQEQHRAEKSLTLQAGAICRRYTGGDKEAAQKLLKAIEDGKDIGPAMVATATILQARSVLEAERKALEKQLSKLATELPVAPWVDGVRGFAILSLAAIVGEAGDLSNYATVSRLWKRMGLAVINGERQRKVAGVDALEQGYAPHRRSLMWVIGDNMIRATKPGGNEPYRAFYEVEKAKQLAKGISLGHANNRAKRHMTKKLLCDLWVAWGAAK